MNNERRRAVGSMNNEQLTMNNDGGRVGFSSKFCAYDGGGCGDIQRACRFAVG